MQSPSDASGLVPHSNAVVLVNRPNTFIRLHEDVLFQICEWLCVRDILALRSTDKSIYASTGNSSIWLSVIRRLALGFPPGQPILPDLLGYYPRSSLEFFVTRALKLEQSWRDYNPHPSHYRFNGHQGILSMRNLPGGKHMVSVSQEQGSGTESVVVWDMNYRGRRNHVAIAMLNSETPVHKLQARYAMASGRLSLLVAFTRPPVDGRTMIYVTYIAMDVLEHLSTLGPGSPAFLEFSNLGPNPFTKLLETRTRYSVGALSLSDVGGHPILAAVHRPRTIAFYFLQSGARASLKLTDVPGYDHWRHSIWEIKILSSQNQILVIRVLIGELDNLDTQPLVFEIYDIPPVDTESEKAIPCERKVVKDYKIDGFYVSDAEASWWFRNHCDPHISMLHRLTDCAPPPISIFVTTKEPRGFSHYLMVPEVTHGLPQGSSLAEPGCVYRLPNEAHALFKWDEEERAVIIPGAYRSIVWMRSPGRQPLQGIEIIRLAVYRTEGYTFSDSLDTGHLSSRSGRQTTNRRIGIDEGAEAMDMEEESLSPDLGPQPVENPKDRAMKYPVVFPEVAQAMRSATRSIQFDEWLGRLCFATTQDNWIQVLDWSI